MQKALADAKLKRESKDIPKSYILAKVNFSRRIRGTMWHFADVIEVKTTISAEKNFAEKVQRVRPLIKIA